MFDSPFALCTTKNEMVLLDQTRKECAREHGCDDACEACPLQRYFTGLDFSQPIHGEPHDDPAP